MCRLIDSNIYYMKGSTVDRGCAKGAYRQLSCGQRSQKVLNDDGNGNTTIEIVELQSLGRLSNKSH